ncbi:hypothetical protein GYMLUDRAFT_49819 [Collybiopsis luxurians FD-317 M1]|uniref:Uncharacterized protein n=1 Tax=Collybiopsis luxurians FD-317 M1 TaxID=944289 RepID=A0A0D0BSS2_9AGAR|nr:hypothetical protein GYMLUDRAFT_49819 [Collybiopsis luxurians FD-317 M1]
MAHYCQSIEANQLFKCPKSITTVDQIIRSVIQSQATSKGTLAQGSNAMRGKANQQQEKGHSKRTPEIVLSKP